MLAPDLKQWVTALDRLPMGLPITIMSRTPTGVLGIRTHGGGVIYFDDDMVENVENPQEVWDKACRGDVAEFRASLTTSCHASSFREALLASLDQRASYGEGAPYLTICPAGNGWRGCALELASEHEPREGLVDYLCHFYPHWAASGDTWEAEKMCAVFGAVGRP
jgi:hypothetical protein